MKDKNIFLFLKNVIFGFVIGIANIIPGVSGGTFALILGIYSDLMEAVGSLTPKFFKDGLNLLKEKKIKDCFLHFFNKHTQFLTKILIGAALSIITMSKLLKSMLENHYEATYGFFLGLIVFSIVVPYKLLDEKKFKHFVWLLVGLGLTLYISIAVDPSAKTLAKSAQYASEIVGTAVAGKGYGIAEFFSNFIVGAFAISAMVLPGISGSFVMLLFGKYDQIISAIARISDSGVAYIQYFLGKLGNSAVAPVFPTEDFIFLGTFGLGIILGGIFFVKLFNVVYAKFKNQTIYFLVGLMFGSFYALWPFKKAIIQDIYIKENGVITLVEGAKIYSNSLTLPANLEMLLPVIGAFVVGSVVMLFFIKYEK